MVHSLSKALLELSLLVLMAIQSTKSILFYVWWTVGIIIWQLIGDVFLSAQNVIIVSTFWSSSRRWNLMDTSLSKAGQEKGTMNPRYNALQPWPQPLELLRPSVTTGSNRLIYHQINNVESNS